MLIEADITGIKYTPLLCAPLRVYTLQDLARALEERGSFILRTGRRGKIAMSWWVSPKRTRSYPYARVYDTLSFEGKRVTIIPLVKDEGKGESRKGCKGDRDFLQWDTISLMSLLGVYVVIAYYYRAEKKPGCRNRLTNQKLDTDWILTQLHELLSYRSDALHWNLAQIDILPEIAERAVRAYRKISRETGVQLHDEEAMYSRLARISQSAIEFKKFSRRQARQAQAREVATVQPKERVAHKKARVNVYNYLGGVYHFTCDEVWWEGGTLHIVEAKHTSRSWFPSSGDIKDALLKMMLWTNFSAIRVNGRSVSRYVPVLKITARQSPPNDWKEKDFIKHLLKEARRNKFKILYKTRWLT